jgi:hypothetical protein
MRWSPLMAKDPNDILQGKFNSEYRCTLREWVQAGMDVAKVVLSKEEAPITIEMPKIVNAPLQGEKLLDVSRIRFYERNSEMRQAIMEEYKTRGLVPSSHAAKPKNVCPGCRGDTWFWSSLANEWLCLNCWTQPFKAVQKRKIAVFGK